MYDFWFQHDGATAHTARETMTILRAAFPGRLISLVGDFTLPSRLPDLTSPLLPLRLSQTKGLP